MCHLWPGITPFNVFDLRYGVWLMFAAEADAWSKQQKEAAKSNG